MYYADKDYYKTKFPKLSLSSNLVSTGVADTIEWALPALMKIFYGSNEAITIQGAYRDWETDRKSTRLNSSHSAKSRMPSSA